MISNKEETVTEKEGKETFHNVENFKKFSIYIILDKSVCF